MSTRSIVVVHDKAAAARLYRHCDGGPPSNLEAIAESRSLGVDDRALGVAASLLEAGVRFEQEWVGEKLSLDTLGDQGDLEWCYFVDTDAKTIAIYGGAQIGTASEHVARGQANPFHSLASMLPSFAASPAFLMQARAIYETVGSQPGEGQLREAMQEEAERAKVDPEADRYVKDQARQAGPLIAQQIAYMNVDATAIRKARAHLFGLGWTINDRPLGIEAECERDAQRWAELNRMVSRRGVHTALIDDKERMPKGPLDGPIIDLGDHFFIQRIKVEGSPVLLLHERKDVMADHLSEGVGYRMEYGPDGSASLRPLSMVRSQGPSMG